MGRQRPPARSRHQLVDIPIEISLIDPNTGLGLTGKAALLELTIQRASDAMYWGGAGPGWVVARSVIYPTEVDPVNEPGKYVYTLPGTGGNVQEDRYTAHGHIDDPPTVQGDAYETHVSETQDVAVYESEPI